MPKRKCKAFAAFDCETDPFEHGADIQPFLWLWYDGENKKHWFNTADFIAFLREYDGVAYAHNGGKFDFYFLLDALEPQDRVMVINGRIAKIKIGKCELRDSWLLFPVPLSAYKKDEIDYNLFTKEKRGDHMPEIIKYGYGDVIYLYELLHAQRDTYGNYLTLASSAFNYFFKNLNPDNYDKPKSSLNYFEKFKPFYYGGRVECFKKGIIEGDFVGYDINSAYPYAMLFNHAYGNDYIERASLPDDFELCFIDGDFISYGALPYRCPDSKKLLFPNDGKVRRYFVTGWEVKAGIDTGTLKIVKINSVYQHKNTINFKSYVEHFYNKKAEFKGKNEAQYLLAKLYLNSLYGKMGQSSLKHKEYSLIEPAYIGDYMDEGYDFESEMGGLALVGKPVSEDKMRFFNVATAASVTGFVRAYLWQHICNSTGPLYCDTDCIIARDFVGIEGKQLGEWEKEGEFIGGAIGGKKLYAFKYKNGKFKVSSKGVKLNADDIFSIAKGDTILYKNEAPTFSIHTGVKYLTRNVKMT